MSKLTWDQTGSRYYETGVKKGVLFVMTDSAYETGVSWNGLTAVNESPSGAEANAFYADNIKYLNLYSTEEFAATVEAYTYPDEFAECDGSAELGTGITIGQQERKTFALSYVTQIGNDTDGDELGYKIHIIYGAKASPSEKAYATISDTPEPITFSWELSTTPIDVDGYKATASLEIDSTKVDATVLASIEDSLYGTDDTEPTLLMPEDIIELLSAE